MPLTLRFFMAWLLLTGCLPAMAHEFWLAALPTGQPAQRTAELSISVGEQWRGEKLPFTTEYIAQLRNYACGTSQDLAPLLPGSNGGSDFAVQLQCGGTQLFALDSHPNVITLPGDKFTAYLHDEGLDDIIKQREAAGRAATPGRERYRRHVKALLQASESAALLSKTDKADKAEKSAGRATNASIQTGQKLEIIPLGDPSRLAAGSSMGFKLLFDGQALPNRLVKAWYRPVSKAASKAAIKAASKGASKGASLGAEKAPNTESSDQTLIIRGQTDSAGVINFNFPYAGPWMISSVHMVAASSADAVGAVPVDWDSYWGNLTFSLPGNASSTRLPQKN